MEHRWGVRVPLRMPVRLRIGTDTDAEIDGLAVNLSLSGAFIKTSRPVPMLARVQVGFGGLSPDEPDTHWVAAYVVRETQKAIGLEWLEFAPEAIVARLQGAGWRATCLAA